MRKKIFTVFIALMMTAVLCFTAACDGDKQQNDQQLSYQQQSYEIALEKGYDGTLEEWIELLRGEDGEDGKSAYQLAVESAGFQGTLEQWIASLKGKDGEDGNDGRGIADVKIEDGVLYIKYTDSDIYVYIGVVKGEDGKDGIDGEDGKDGHDGANGQNGEDGKDGHDGKDGTKILDAYIKDGCLYIFYNDGTTHCAGKVQGDAGRGVVEMKIIDSVLYVRYSDGDDFVEIGSVKGEKGDAGRGIVSAKVENGNLYILYSDADEYEYVGKVQGDKGEPGQNLDINEVYAAAQAGGYEGSLLEFISAFLKVEVNASSEQVISKTLLSTVAIATKYSGSNVSSGSGVIYKGDKQTGEVYIITNFHMVYNANSDDKICDDVYVFFYGMPFVKLSKDNPSYTPEELSNYLLLEECGIKAQYVAGSMTSDIAILKIENCEQYITGPYRPAEMIEDSDLIKEGETSYVVGNAEGIGISATSGIISLQSSDLTITTDTVTGEKHTYRVIRTDAAVNHGNSGGGLYDKDGRLMGIVNAKTQSVTVDNMGYALPLNAVLGVVNNLLTRAEDTTVYDDEVSAAGFGFNKCLLGVTVRETGNYADYDEVTGLITGKSVVEATEVTPGSAADGYILAGDKILTVEINGIKREIYRKYQIGELLLYAKKGDIAVVTVLREGQQVRLEIPLIYTTYMK